MSKKKQHPKNNPTDFSVTPILTQPETPYDMLHKYGTYNIQPTADSDNEFPAIGHGIPKDAGDLAKRE